MAGYFGAAFVLDEKPGQTAPSNGTPVSCICVRGTSTGTLVRRPYDKPRERLQWSDGPESVLSSLALLHDLEQARSLDDTALEHIEQRDTAPAEIRVCYPKAYALDLMMQGRGRLTVKATRYVLARSFAESLQP